MTFTDNPFSPIKTEQAVSASLPISTDILEMPAALGIGTDDPMKEDDDLMDVQQVDLDALAAMKRAWLRESNVPEILPFEYGPFENLVEQLDYQVSSFSFYSSKT